MRRRNTHSENASVSVVVGDVIPHVVWVDNVSWACLPFLTSAASMLRMRRAFFICLLLGDSILLTGDGYLLHFPMFRLS